MIKEWKFLKIWKGKIVALFEIDIADKCLIGAEKSREIHNQDSWSGNRNLKKGIPKKSRIDAYPSFDVSKQITKTGLLREV
jgi:hypothetical protein